MSVPNGEPYLAAPVAAEAPGGKIAGLPRADQMNVRATMLLAQAFMAAFAADSGGRLILFSSGQRLGPMPHELAYAVSKAAVENLTRQLAPGLMSQGITVNSLRACLRWRLAGLRGR